MAFIPTSNTLKTVLRFSQFGRIYTNTLCWYKPGGWPEGQAIDACNTVFAEWVGEMLSYQSNTVTLLNVVGYDMSDVEGYVVTNSTGTPDTGDDTSPALPGNVTATISLRTSNRGKSGRGRIYYIGLTEAKATSNELASGVAAEIEGRFEAFWSTVESVISADLAVVSFQLNNVPRSTGFVQNVTSVIVDAGIDTQRRRIKPV